jgi:hypothetical protein
MLCKQPPETARLQVRIEKWRTVLVCDAPADFVSGQHDDRIGSERDVPAQQRQDHLPDAAATHHDNAPGKGHELSYGSGCRDPLNCANHALMLADAHRKLDLATVAR